MGIKRFLLLASLVLSLLLFGGCSGKDKGLEISFADTDFSNVNSILLINLHSGEQTYIEDTESVEDICHFLRNIKGNKGTSAKGYYEGSYGVALYANASASAAVLESETPIVSIGFGDTASFYYGEYEDGYPVRYTLTSIIIEEVITFFKQYDHNAIADNATRDLIRTVIEDTDISSWTASSNAQDYTKEGILAFAQDYPALKTLLERKDMEEILKKTGISMIREYTMSTDPARAVNAMTLAEMIRILCPDLADEVNAFLPE